MATKDKDLNDLFLDTLKDIYFAEKQILKALPKMAKAATSDKLRAAFEKHHDETEGQVERLEQIFELLDKPARGKTCDAILGILDEGKEIMDEYKGTSSLDAGLLAAAQAVEHYEISRYGTLKAWATELGMKDAVRLLDETLNQEKKTDESLSVLAKSETNLHRWRLLNLSPLCAGRGRRVFAAGEGHGKVLILDYTICGSQEPLTPALSPQERGEGARGRRVALNFTLRPVRSLPSAGTSRPGCDHHRRCRRGRPGTSICRCVRSQPGSSLRRGCKRASSRHPRCRAPYAARDAAATPRRSSGRSRYPRSPCGSRSSPHRTDRVRVSIPIPSARSSACPRQESSWSARGSRSRSGAWRCRRR
jgi:ferritin-like metal-binding protein YciE